MIQINKDAISRCGSCCSARCCQLEGDPALTKPQHTQPLPAPAQSSPLQKGSDGTHKPPTICCSHNERQILGDALLAWQDQEWAAIKATSPEIILLRWSAVLTQNQLNVLVSKGHRILGAEQLDGALYTAHAVNELTHLQDSKTLPSAVGQQES
jgi:hypothetical protein